VGGGEIEVANLNYWGEGPCFLVVIKAAGHFQATQIQKPGIVSQMAKFQVAVVKSQYQSIRNEESTITQMDHRARGIFQIAST